MEIYPYLIALYFKKRNADLNLLVNLKMQKLDAGSHMANVTSVLTKPLLLYSQNCCVLYFCNGSIHHLTVRCSPLTLTSVWHIHLIAHKQTH